MEEPADGAVRGGEDGENVATGDGGGDQYRPRQSKFARLVTKLLNRVRQIPEIRWLR